MPPWASSVVLSTRSVPVQIVPHNCHLVPFLPCGYALDSALQELPVGIQLFRGLVEVPSIGGQCSFAQGDNCSTGRARESRNEFYGNISYWRGQTNRRGAIVDLGGHHMARCIRTGGYLLRAQLYKAGKHNSRFKQPTRTQMMSYCKHRLCAAASTASALTGVQRYPRPPYRLCSVDRKRRSILDGRRALVMAKMSKGELDGRGAWTLVVLKRFLNLLAFEKLSEGGIKGVR